MGRPLAEPLPQNQASIKPARLADRIGNARVLAKAIRGWL